MSDYFFGSAPGRAALISDIAKWFYEVVAAQGEPRPTLEAQALFLAGAGAADVVCARPSGECPVRIAVGVAAIQ
jgi:hypothetical protein